MLCVLATCLPVVVARWAAANLRLLSAASESSLVSSLPGNVHT